MNPNNSYRFNWMLAYRWTIKEIQATFQVPRAIARHIQATYPNEQECFAIAAASKELREQIGF